MLAHLSPREADRLRPSRAGIGFTCIAYVFGPAWEAPTVCASTAHRDLPYVTAVGAQVLAPVHTDYRRSAQGVGGVREQHLSPHPRASVRRLMPPHHGPRLDTSASPTPAAKQMENIINDAELRALDRVLAVLSVDPKAGALIPGTVPSSPPTERQQASPSRGWVQDRQQRLSEFRQGMFHPAFLREVLDDRGEHVPCCRSQVPFLATHQRRGGSSKANERPSQSGRRCCVVPVPLPDDLRRVAVAGEETKATSP